MTCSAVVVVVVSSLACIHSLIRLCDHLLIHVFIFNVSSIVIVILYICYNCDCMHAYLRYRSNGYILGAGTGASSLADKEVQDMGIVFDAAYSIYDVREAQGHQLLKLRYPPGDLPRWRGDWGEGSPLWNAKLRMKMGMKESMKEGDSSSFYMSFDDFCNVFRYLYVCKYYTPTRWTEISLPGIWQKANVGELEKQQLQAQLTREMGQEDLQRAYQSKKLEVQRVRAMMDSAGGLPSTHNPACILENNPHYSFRIHRPSDFRITVIQYANNSREQLVIHPISIIVAKSQHPDEAYRLEQLNKSEIMYTTGTHSTYSNLRIPLTHCTYFTTIL